MAKFQFKWYHILGMLILLVGVGGAIGYIRYRDKESKDLKGLNEKDKKKITALQDRVMELENENMSKDEQIESFESIIDEINKHIGESSFELHITDEIPEEIKHTKPIDIEDFENIPGESNSEFETLNEDSSKKDSQELASEEEMKNKIPWNWTAPTLEAIFSQLTSSNHQGEPFLTQEEVDEFLKNNFACYNDKPTQKVFSPRIKHKYTLEYFIYQVYEQYKNHQSEIDNYAMLLINNFTQWKNSDLKSLKKNISRSARQKQTRIEMENHPHYLLLQIPS